MKFIYFLNKSGNGANEEFTASASSLYEFLLGNMCITLSLNFFVYLILIPSFRSTLRNLCTRKINNSTYNMNLKFKISQSHLISITRLPSNIEITHL